MKARRKEMETLSKKESVQLAKGHLKEFLQPLGFRTFPRAAHRFVRAREEFIDEFFLYTAPRRLMKLDCYIRARSAPFAWLRCDEERLWRAAGKPVSELSWKTVLLLERGTEYWETVWRDVARALGRCVLPEMEAMTTEAFLSRLSQNSEEGLFLAYQTIDLEQPRPVCAPMAAGYGIELWHLGQFEEGASYLRYAREGYRAQMADCGQEDVWRRQFMELALIEDLLSHWEGEEEGWMEAVRQRIGQVAADWVKYM